eukprot:7910914-Alexandrium_andersonii.AAC.3
MACLGRVLSLLRAPQAHFARFVAPSNGLAKWRTALTESRWPSTHWHAGAQPAWDVCRAALGAARPLISAYERQLHNALVGAASVCHLSHLYGRQAQWSFALCASGAHAGPLRRKIRHVYEKWRRMHASGASGTNAEVVSGAGQFELRTPEAI